MVLRSRGRTPRRPAGEAPSGMPRQRPFRPGVSRRATVGGSGEAGSGGSAGVSSTSGEHSATGVYRRAFLREGRRSPTCSLACSLSARSLSASAPFAEPSQAPPFPLCVKEQRAAAAPACRCSLAMRSERVGSGTHRGSTGTTRSRVPPTPEKGQRATESEPPRARLTLSVLATVPTYAVHR